LISANLEMHAYLALYSYMGAKVLNYIVDSLLEQGFSNFFDL